MKASPDELVKREEDMYHCDGWAEHQHETEEEIIAVKNPQMSYELIRLCPRCLKDFYKDYPPGGMGQWMKGK